jgi:tetratricopeptide (TPR) repeat protein
MHGPRLQRTHDVPSKAKYKFAGLGIILAAVAIVCVLYFRQFSTTPTSNDLEFRAFTTLQEGREEEAWDLFLQLESQGASAAAKAGLAGVALRRNRFEEARRLSEQAIVQDPDKAYARAVLGQVLVREPETADRGIEALRAALAGDLPYSWQRADTHRALGRAYESRGNYAQAVEEFEAATRAGDQSPETLRALAGLYAKADREDDAIEMYREAVKEYPGDRWAEAGLAILQGRLEFEQNKDKQEQVRKLIDGFRSGQTTVRDTNPDQWSSRLMGLAVLPPRQSGGPIPRDDEDEYFAYFLMRSLAKSSRIRVVDREVLEAVLTELRMSQNGLTDAGHSVRIGEILSARLVIAPTLFYLPGKIRAEVRLIDVETTRVISQPQFDSTDGVDDLIQPIAEQIFQDIRDAYPVQGRVTSVSMEKRISLNVGSGHGVRDGMALEVLESETENAPRIGIIKVTQVNTESSLAVITRADREITPELPVREIQNKK